MADRYVSHFEAWGARRWMRRLCVVALSSMVIGPLLLASFALPASPHRIPVISFIWVIGAVALTIVVLRLWPAVDGKADHSWNKKLAVCGLLTAALVSWFSCMGLWQYYDATRPTKPNVDVGRVIRQNTHGSVVYLTHEEQFRIHALGVGAFLFFLAGAFLYKHQRSRSDDDGAGSRL